jgi:cell division transport system ATP-binding protein
MDELVISYNHVNIYQGKDLVLSDVTLDVQQGEFIYLIGKTGAGKSSSSQILVW